MLSRYQSYVRRCCESKENGDGCFQHMVLKVLNGGGDYANNGVYNKVVMMVILW